jgi:hypothetical protein
MYTDTTSSDADTTSTSVTTTVTITTQAMARQAAEACSSLFEPFLAAGRYKIVVARDDGELSPYVVLAESKAFQILSTGQSYDACEAQEQLRQLNLPLARPSSKFERNLLSNH